MLKKKDYIKENNNKIIAMKNKLHYAENERNNFLLFLINYIMN